jgi:rare lipoprotein A
MSTNFIIFFILSIIFGQKIIAKEVCMIPADTNINNKIQYGIASYYSDKFIGRKTANGEVFNQDKMTAAHNTFPLGTCLIVTNLRNNREVKVRVNDRLHHRNKRVIDLTKGAARKIGFINSGITRVKVEVVKP